MSQGFFLDKPVFPLLLEGEATGTAWSIYQFIHHTDVRDGSLPSSQFYDRLERYTPRQKTAGGVRVDGIYLCNTKNPLFREALRFYADESVASFIIPVNETISRKAGNESELLDYTVQDDLIQFAFQSGRNMTARFKDSKLNVRIKYPNGQRDTRWYTFVPFED